MVWTSTLDIEKPALDYDVLARSALSPSIQHTQNIKPQQCNNYRYNELLDIKQTSILAHHAWYSTAITKSSKINPMQYHSTASALDSTDPSNKKCLEPNSECHISATAIFLEPAWLFDWSHEVDLLKRSKKSGVSQKCGAINQIIQESAGYSKPPYKAFIGHEKAFDLAEIRAALEALYHQGICGRYTSMCVSHMP